ncbi:MAG: DUF1207 domain-containing protein [Ignavibacteriales bacterium CG_4_9_14_3_um_filter_34_10]|nr:MAG: DUF1207 domain-containing protein [Ignavibacteriales bacterium CG_4_9_14_3_um_filter_34_10]
MLKKFFCFLLLLLNPLLAQSELVYFPDKLNVKPFFANQLEPKMGFLFDINKTELRLDVGNSVDILHKYLSGNETLSFGADFFTYSLLRRKKDFKFPVAAIDYLFGLNAAYVNNIDKLSYGLRIRISHISAHLVDGSFSIIKNGWEENLYPFVYSREFFEFTPFIKKDNLRLYAALTLIYHVKPSNLGKDGYQVGGEYLFPNLLSEHIHGFIGSDLKIMHLDDYNLNFTFQTGLQFGNENAEGISIYYEFFSGKNIHGELFNRNVSNSSIGINFDF